MASLLRMVQEQQLRLTRSLQGHIEQFREQHNLPQEVNQPKVEKRLKKDSSSFESANHSFDCHEHDLNAETQHIDGANSFHCEERDNDTDKLESLLKDVQEERFSVDQMLDDVRQEKLEVIAAMHTFHLEKSDAIQEMEGFRQAAQDELARHCSKHKDQLSELHEKILPQATLLSPLQVVSPSCQPSGQPSVSLPFCNTSSQALPVQLMSPAPVQYAGSASVPLQPSLSSQTVMGALSPRAPTRSDRNESGNRWRRFGSADVAVTRITPRGVSPYTTPARTTDSFNHMQMSAR